MNNLDKYTSNNMPEPGSNEWEKMVDFMRADLESGMAYSKIIAAGMKAVEESLKCNACGCVWHRDANSTGYCEECGSADVRERNFYEEFETWKKERK